MRYWCGIAKLDPDALSSGTSIDWSGRGLDDAKAKMLADATPAAAAAGTANEEICVSVAFNRLTSVGVAAILTAIKPNRIRELDVSGCKLPPESEPQHVQLARILYASQFRGACAVKSPRCLTLSCCGLDGISGAAALCTALQKAYASGGLEQLDVSRNTLGDDGIGSLLQGLGDSRTSLKSLNLSNTGLSSDGIWPLCAAIRGIVRTHGPAAASAECSHSIVAASLLLPTSLIGDILSGHDIWTIHHQRLEGHISESCAAATENRLPCMRSLESINLEGACLSDHGIGVLIAGLFGFPTSPPLVHLDLTSCRLDGTALALVAKAVGDARFGRLQRLVLTCNRFDALAMDSLATALGRPAVTLRELLIESKQPSCESLDRLLQAMAACAGLVRWHVGRARRGDAVKDEPAAAAERASMDATVKTRDRIARFALAMR